MPADLTKPFAESCCDGGECSITQHSAQPCGCDPGARYFCANHTFKAEATRLVALWRTYGRVSSHNGFEQCADDLEAIL